MKVIAALVAGIVMAVSCGGTSVQPGPEPTVAGCGTKAIFILANPGGLSCLDEAGRSLGKVVKLPDQSAPSTPAIHPSGTAFAFALTQQPDPKRGFGSDVYMVNLDGSNLHAIVLHEDNNVFYASPRFDSSGNVLYVHRRAAIITNGSYSGNEDNIVRIDLRTGESKRIIKDGADPTISPDGKMIVYVHLKDSQIDALWRADIDGSNPAPFLKTKDGFWYLQAPRFSPTECQLAFSAAGHTVGEASGGADVALRHGDASGKEAHLSIPSELREPGLDRVVDDREPLVVADECGLHGVDRELLHFREAQVCDVAEAAEFLRERDVRHEAIVGVHRHPETLLKKLADGMRLERRRRAGVDVAGGTELERDTLVAHIGGERSKARDTAGLDGHVLDKPYPVSDAVRAADLQRLPDGARTEALAGVDGDREVLAVAQLERVEVLLRRMPCLLARDVEADDALVAIVDGEPRHLERIGAIAHRADDLPQRNGVARFRSREALRDR